MGIEQTIAEFERQYAEGKSPDIRLFVSENCGDQDQNGDRIALMTELIHTEMELRLQAGGPVRVEDYIKQYPELAGDSTWIRELLRTEYRVRRSFDPGCRLEEYVLRFPHWGQSLVDDFLHSSTGDDGMPCSADIPQLSRSHSDLSARFRKQKLQEHGGLGNVWLAHDAELEREVAVKEIKAKFVASTTHRIRFLRETRITSKLEHPGIVPVYGQGQSPGGSPFFAMQFIQGQNLGTCIRDYYSNGGSNGPGTRQMNRLLQHFMDVCDTVEYAHSQGIIHRDIKPGNIMIGQFGETFLIDWGLAGISSTCQPNSSSAADEAILDDTASYDGQTVGSPAFMSPEQAQGNHSRVGVRSDVYCLGATLFSMIANSENPNADIGKYAENLLPHPGDLGAGNHPLLSICRKAMAKAPGLRYGSAHELREEIESFIQDRPVRAHRDSALDRWSRFLRRNRTFLNSILASMLLLSTLSVSAAIWINAERRQALSAKESESHLRKRAELANQREAAARKSAENRTGQLTAAIGIFTGAVAGSDDAGLQIDPSSISGKQIIDRLNAEIDSHDDPIVRAMLNAVVARGNRGAGKYTDAIRHYEMALDLLNDDQIAPADPLYLEFLAGLAATHLAAGNTDQATEMVERITELCRRSPEQHEKTYFKVLLAEAQIALRRNDAEKALKAAYEANELGGRIYAESTADNNLTWAKYVLADVHRRLGNLGSAVQLFEEIVGDQKTEALPHPLKIVSAVQLSEIQFPKTPEKSLAMIQQACRDAAAVYGEDHPDTYTIQARMGQMLAERGDIDSRNRAVEILENCSKWQIARAGKYNREALATTLFLAESLLGFEQKEKSLRAVAVISDAIKSLENSADADPAFMAALYDKLSNAWLSLGENRQSIDSMEKAVNWADSAYGEWSAITKQLKEKRNSLQNQK